MSGGQGALDEGTRRPRRTSNFFHGWRTGIPAAETGFRTGPISGRVPKPELMPASKFERAILQVHVHTYICRRWHQEIGLGRLLRRLAMGMANRSRSGGDLFHVCIQKNPCIRQSIQPPELSSQALHFLLTIVPHVLLSVLESASQSRWQVLVKSVGPCCPWT